MPHADAVMAASQNRRGQRQQHTKLAAIQRHRISAARFFYCAKASKADRDEGLHGFAKSLPASALARTSQLRGEESTCISATKTSV